MTEHSSQTVQQRTRKFFTYLVAHKQWLIYLALLFILILSFNMRTQNLTHLTDATTGEYIPLALDPLIFLRYAQEIAEHILINPKDFDITLNATF